MFSRPDPVEYVYEQGAHRAIYEVSRVFDELCKDKDTAARFRLGGWSFEDKRDVIQLQAADVLAYELWKHMENREVDGIKRPFRKSLRNLRRPWDVLDFYFRESLIELAALSKTEDLGIA